MSITRQDARTIGREVEEALAAVANRHGLVVKVTGGTYDGTTFKPRVVFETEDHGAVAFTALAALYGLDPSDYGREFVFRSKRYALKGINSRRPKFPFDAYCLTDGKTYKFAEATIMHVLNRPHERRAAMLAD